MLAQPPWRLSPSQLLIQREAGTAILLPASLIGLAAELLLLAVAHGAHAVRAHTPVDQRLLGRIGTVFTQRQVVLSRSAVIAISPDNDLERGMRGQETRVLGQDCLGIGTDLIAVIVEEGGLYILLEDLLVHGLAHWWRRRRRSYGQGCTRICGSTGAAGDQMVGRRLAGQDVQRTVGILIAQTIDRDIRRIGSAPREHCASARVDRAGRHREGGRRRRRRG